MRAQPQREPLEGFSPEDFLRFLSGRSEEERWQLIDGTPFMMTPPTLIHQRIAMNLVRILNDAVETHRPELFAMQEVGLQLDAYDRFRPIADAAVVDYEIDDSKYAANFYLAAEILSESNSGEYISLKRQRYSEAPSCLHVLILHQAEMGIEVWSRSNEWQGRIFRSADDVIELPEFGAVFRLGGLYRGTPVR